MNKYLKWGLIIIGGLAILLFALFTGMRMYTKSFSPENVVALEKGDLQVSVFYNRPFKKGRKIFGDLVPYGEVWRTGANEATVFETNQDLNFNGKTLGAGKYTLFTIPNPDFWTVIWNNKEYPWGLNFDGTSPREPAFDVMAINAEVSEIPNVVEQFTITLEEGDGLVFTWDQTRVSVPFEN